MTTNREAATSQEREHVLDLTLLSDHWLQWWQEAADRAAPSWLDLVDEFAALQNSVAASVPPEETVAEVRELVARTRTLLDAHRVPDEGQVFGRLLSRPSRGQAFSPAIWMNLLTENELSGTVEFGPFYSGNNGAAHGGAIALLFDDVLGRLSDVGERGRSRTAYLHVDYRSLTPLGTRLTVRARFDRQEGRKRFLTGQLLDGGRLCAEATGLFVEMKPEQA